MKKMKQIIKEGTRSKFEGGTVSKIELVEYGGQKYVLRSFKSKKKADYYASILKKLKKYGFKPKVLYQNKKQMLLEFIRGRDCRESDASKAAYQVGKICAAVNKIKNSEGYNLNKKFNIFLNIIEKKKVLPKTKIKSARILYKILYEKLKPKIVLDANDIYAENFKIVKGKIYFVDVEAIRPTLKGYGIVKCFNRWFQKPSQQKEFLKGYNSIGDSKFLTKDYIKFVSLFFYIRSIALRLMFNNLPHRVDLSRLLKLLKDQDK
tara:strand:+ start:70 stop:858 length:789 start_codon:yes stop_codon:yes gene_type:complete